MDAHEDVFIYLVGWVGGFVGILGLVGNGLSLAVLSSRDIRGSNSTLYLIALGIYDMTFLLLNLLLTSLDWLVYGMDGVSEFHLLFIAPASLIVDPVIALTISGSVYTTVAFTIDRSIAVSKPLDWASLCTRWRIKMALLLVFLWSLLTTGPLFAEFKYHSQFIPTFNQSYLLPTESDYGVSDFHQDIYLPYFIPITTFLIPSLGIFIPNVVIIVSLKRMRRESKAHAQSAKQTETSRLTAQVLFISLFSLVSRLLHAFAYFVMKQEGTPYVSDCSLFCAVLAAVNAFMLTLNSAINFICYCVFGVKFRKAFIDMVYRRCSSVLRLRQSV